MSVTETLVRWRYRYLPDHVLGELLNKKWSDSAIPFFALLLIVAIFGPIVPRFFDFGTLSILSAQVAELGLIVLGLSIVMISGGIDLSVGSTFALTVTTALYAMNVQGASFATGLLATMAVGMCCGMINGLMVGVLRMRAFLTTLVTLIIYRSIFDIVFPEISTDIVMNYPESGWFEFLGIGLVWGLPVSFLVMAAISVALHIVLSRGRYGWRLMAVGGARRSAHNAGINVRWTVFSAYVICSGFVALAAFLFAARIGSAASDIGAGLELQALTATVLGGISLGGGRGSVSKALMGTVFVLLLSNSLLSLGIPGPVNSLLLGLILVVAVFLDVRWVKNRHKLLRAVYISPTFNKMPPAISTDEGPMKPNDRLKDVGVIGLGILDGAEDVIFDRDDNLYTGSRHGDILRWFPPDYTRHEVFAHIGGAPMGMLFDADGNMSVCVGGMGLYRITPQGEVSLQTAETNRSWTSVADDSVMKLADDCDILPDGRIIFSEATIRFEMHDWYADALESRGNGRLICFDPKTNSTRTIVNDLIFPNGVCTSYDGESVLFAESWACRINRYYYAGPKKGKVERVIEGLPGYPDNINRASDGTYWLALMGSRTPALDLSLEMPGFRRRMARRVSEDSWLMPNLNTGCVLRFNEKGEILESLWDLGGQKHPMITSMREHKGTLYLCGIFNNRMGTLKLPDADQTWCGVDSYWGKPA
ncbi:ABC transporter permease [Paracoccus seriniphilus]|uniref:Monosaccharide ABC transporter membrane protein, CUT2 family n=1 Tax=Paracoccus seriniphilus TaxID=184748 RepID=A0A239Q4D8_9RHOB|nr:SMP-30/gluconolactonase/LRE family protein [Paracoccus seriniphilus]WCR15931.1 SMP-30/gluconolactonase/LRE family protein [Paracoccus seriniphilus]SNT76817.1 monosaccharide ABC transporter membrane protein, CUT2 family [Paracoccus seriniphilus]